MTEEIKIEVLLAACRNDDEYRVVFAERARRALHQSTDPAALARACQQGRKLGGWDLLGLKPIPARGAAVTLDEVTFQTVQQAVERHQGNRTAAGRELHIDRRTVTDILKRAGQKTIPLPKEIRAKIIPLARLAALLLVAVQTLQAQMPPLPTLPVTETVIHFRGHENCIGVVWLANSGQIATRSALIAPTVTNRGERITLEWSSIGMLEGTRIYASSNRLDWFLVAETLGNQVTVTSLPPVWFMGRSFLPGDESADSNRVGWLSNETLVELSVEPSPDLQTWGERIVFFRGTNLPGMKFWRPWVSQETRRVIE